MSNIAITMTRDYVLILGHKIDRPPSASPTQWLEFWRPLDSRHQDALSNTVSPKAGHLPPDLADEQV